MQLGVLTEKLAADVSGRQERQSINITKVEELISSHLQSRRWFQHPQKSRRIEQITGIARSSDVMLTNILANHIAASHRPRIEYLINRIETSI